MQIRSALQGLVSRLTTDVFSPPNWHKVVWALDLDHMGLASQAYISSQGSQSGFGLLGQIQVKKAINEQSFAQAALFWTPCLNNVRRHCPYGHHDIGMVAHGKVFNFDLQATASGCNGANNLVLCVPTSMIREGCAWHRDGQGVCVRGQNANHSIGLTH